MSSEWAEYLVMVPILGGIAFVARYFQKAADERLDASFATAAKKLGLTFVPREKAWFGKRSLVTGEVDRCNVRVDSFLMSKNKSTVTFTRIVVRGSGAPDSFTLSVSEGGIASSITSLFGVHDIEIGERVFDDMFTVKSSAPDLARRVLRGALSRTLLEVAPRGTEVHFKMDADAVELISKDAVEDPTTLVAMVHAATALARAPGIALDRWSDLARAVGGTLGPMDIWQAKGELPEIALEARGVKAVVRPGDDAATVRLHPADTTHARFDAVVLRSAGFALNEGGAIAIDATTKDIGRAMEAVVAATRTVQMGAPYRE